MNRVFSITLHDSDHKITMPRKARKFSKLSKHWVYTINNPTEDDGERIQNNLDKIAYIIIAKEIGDEGTEHMQGYVCFNNRQRLTGVKKLFPRAHLEIKKGTVKEAIDYCKKDGDYMEYGKVPRTAKEGQQDLWKGIVQSAKEGRFDDIPEQILTRYYHAFKRMEQDNPTIPAPLTTKDNHWIVAPTGYGKSTYAREMFPDYFDKAPNKWFIGYKGQETILCDDFGPEQCQYLKWYIKRWADLFAFPMETKGGGKNIRPKHIVITSQYTIDECFDDIRTADAIKGRFKVLQLTKWQERNNNVKK